MSKQSNVKLSLFVHGKYRRTKEVICNEDDLSTIMSAVRALQKFFDISVEVRYDIVAEKKNLKENDKKGSISESQISFTDLLS